MSLHAIPTEQSKAITVPDPLEHITRYNPYEEVLATSIYTDIEIEKEFEKEFEELKDSWVRDTSLVSGYKEKVNHPAYSKILSYGKEIIPLLLKDMVENRIHWFYALTDITDENPIQSTSRGKINLIINDWLKWARKKGYDI